MKKLPRETLLDWKLGIYAFAIIAAIWSDLYFADIVGIDSNVSSAISFFLLLICLFPAIRPAGTRTWHSFIRHSSLSVIGAVIDYVAHVLIHRHLV